MLGSYGSGAVMAVPAHDERDFEFAAKFDLPVKAVVMDKKGGDVELPFTGKGVASNSGEFDGLKTQDCKKKVAKVLSRMERGGEKIQYKLRDWVFSRQRYWGEPIPIFFPVTFPSSTADHSALDPKVDEHTIDYDTPMPVPENELPLTLPPMEDFSPGDDPAGCLARAADWRYFMKDGSWYARETNTMPQWAGSCWYYLRYPDNKNSDQAWSAKADADWLPVDLYVGGAEHAVLHLLYARFWHQVMYDLGHTKHPEPFQKLVHQGMILGADGEKMSKSRGNVVNPDDIVTGTGADSLRLYEMFMGPLEAVKPWQTEQVSGVVRFQRKLYDVARRCKADGFSTDDESDDTTKVRSDEERRTKAVCVASCLMLLCLIDKLIPHYSSLRSLQILHKSMKKVTEDIENMSFNTGISALMVLTNHLAGLKSNPSKDTMGRVAIMLAPFAPHLGEEIWSMTGGAGSVSKEPWVEWDESLTIDTTVVMGVQVNGKVRGEIEMEKDEEDERVAMERANGVEKVTKFLEGKEIKKVIYKPGKILNIIVAK